ncbi:hypothetical protein EAF04_004309 [Stromatinia cepivora]|nr:hypothetical protein EAF04_004309 [Stromatinia cepivora]
MYITTAQPNTRTRVAVAATLAASSLVCLQLRKTLASVENVIMAQTQQPTIWGLGIAFSIIAIAAVVLRFQARRIKAQKLEIDDWTILAALTLGIAITIDILIMTHLGGLGAHSQYDDDGDPLDPESIIIFGKILVGFVIAWTITFTFALSCTPIASQWDSNLEFTCVNQEVLFTTALATDVATDCIFILGGLVSIVGIIRIRFLTQVYTVLDDSPEADTTWIYAPVFYWTIIETNVGVLSACLPTLHPLQERFLHNNPFTRLRKLSTHLTSSSNGKRSNKTGDIRLSSMEEEMLLDGKNIPAASDYSL